MFCMATDQPDTPMWVGFNARLFRFASSPLPKQKICYFPQIDESPTSSSVVRETMNMAKKVAEECMQQYVSVTYDLAIAKVAFPIQEEDSSYSNIFIQLGSFHILLSYFKAIGKLIDHYLDSCKESISTGANASILSSPSLLRVFISKVF